MLLIRCSAIFHSVLLMSSARNSICTGNWSIGVNYAEHFCVNVIIETNFFFVEIIHFKLTSLRLGQLMPFLSLISNRNYYCNTNECRRLWCLSRKKDDSIAGHVKPTRKRRLDFWVSRVRSDMSDCAWCRRYNFGGEKKIAFGAAKWIAVIILFKAVKGKSEVLKSIGYNCFSHFFSVVHRVQAPMYLKM